MTEESKVLCDFQLTAAILEAFIDAVNELKTYAKAHHSCEGCAAHGDDDEIPKGAPDCFKCKNNSLWVWRGLFEQVTN